MARKGVGGDRQPSAHERQLFEYAMRDVRPMTAALAAPPALPADAGHEISAAPDVAVAPKLQLPPPAKIAAAAPPRSIPASNMTAGLDRRTAQRLKRGRVAPEAKLDLHGHTAPEARHALDRFLARAVAREFRCVLIVTGTAAGRVRDDEIMPARSVGILRASLPGWLDEPVNRVRVIAHCPAQPRHGGAGARYVLLRRRRR